MWAVINPRPYGAQVSLRCDEGVLTYLESKLERSEGCLPGCSLRTKMPHSTEQQGVLFLKDLASCSPVGFHLNDSQHLQFISNISTVARQYILLEHESHFLLGQFLASQGTCCWHKFTFMNECSLPQSGLTSSGVLTLCTSNLVKIVTEQTLMHRTVLSVIFTVKFEAKDVLPDAIIFVNVPRLLSANWTKFSGREMATDRTTNTRC